MRKIFFTHSEKKEFLLSTIFLFLLVGLVLAQANPYTTPPSTDSGFFLYSGAQILKGKLPYIDFWDSKGPLIFYINALGLLIGQGSRWGVWALEFILLLIESTIFFNVAQRRWGNGTALFSSIAWLYGLSLVFGGGNFTEEYSLFFNFIALSLFISDKNRSDKALPILLGIAIAINLMLRANNIGVPIAILFAISFKDFLSKKYKSLLEKTFTTLFTGVAIFLVSYIIFSRSGVFTAMIEASVLYNFFYTKSFHSSFFSEWTRILHIGWPAYVAIFGYFSILYQIIIKRSNKAISNLAIFSLVIFPLEIVLSSLSGRGYLHYAISWMPAIAVLTAISFHSLSEHIFSPVFLKTLESKEKSSSMLILGIAFIYFASGTFQTYQKTAEHFLFERSNGIEYQDQLTNFLRDNTTTHDTILGWGVFPSINYTTKRDSPTPYLFYPAYEKSPYTEKISLHFLEAIKESPPAMIVDRFLPQYILSIDPVIRAVQLSKARVPIYRTTPYQDDFFNFVEENYVYIKTIDDIDIYKLTSNLK